LNHLTVIEVGEPVVQVAAGSPSFKVEWRENKVFVQPTEADASTNLFIWTANERLNYELEPAAALADMDFALDQAPPRAEPVKQASAPPPAPPSTAQLLLEGKPVRLISPGQHASKPVEVWISDVYERDGRVLVRYALRNHGDEAYSAGRPEVYQLEGVRSRHSLYGLANSQLNDQEASKLKVKREIRVNVLDSQTGPARIAPGAEAVGVVSFEMAATTQPTVLRFEFPSAKPSNDPGGDRQPPVEAFLVR